MERKNTLLLTVIAVATLLVAVVGATFAYFTAQGGGDASTSITVTTHTTDSATFNAGTAINFAVNQDNFAQADALVEAKYPSGTASGSATFTASDAEAADLCYNVTVDITNNTFLYSSTNTAHDAELTLTVAKTPNGGSKTTLIDKMDITTTTTDVQVPTTKGGSDYKHVLSATAGQTVTDAFDVTVTVVNLDADQQDLAAAHAAFAGTILYTKVAC